MKKKVNDNISKLDQHDIHIIDRVQKISRELLEIEMTASTYLLNRLLSKYTKSNNELSLAIHKLSSHRHGALMVIEANDPVSPLIKEGIPINAVITSQLLESIFHPGSTLRNGAVLIVDDFIASASNVLPLTEKIFWDRTADIRELSAIGLSELSDALIILITDNGSTYFSLAGNLFPFRNSNRALRLMMGIWG
ncbi:DNA integrity scanning protein DisA nucleotide-binding domain protein [Paenibacillus sp. DMB20]|uniref:DNA integrity scanning protein DisA nucleotide-binding domain protein n=1 Tax=Paenibacillus sp. DMB20 TaxID=1642570 RepID=UPI000627C3DA|nr:DNA integrity scanning protein DisA nucleotide-binding domain protein [Paenibacillus sp. DMB20]